MSMRYEGGCAFPVPEYSPGMTLRDWFAGQALAGIIRDRDAVRALNSEPEWPLERSIADAAYQLADAMLHAREEVAS